MQKELDTLIEHLDDTLCELGVNANSINSTIRILEVIKGLRGNIVGLSDEDFESMILGAIKGQ